MSDFQAGIAGACIIVVVVTTYTLTLGLAKSRMIVTVRFLSCHLVSTQNAVNKQTERQVLMTHCRHVYLGPQRDEGKKPF